MQLIDVPREYPKIKVIGVGDSGGRIMKSMSDAGLSKVDFICVNTDAQALRRTDVWTPIEIGRNLPRQTFVGPSIDMIREATFEGRDQILRLIDGVDMVFVVAGMGGVTGTGAAPVVAQLARESGALTIGLATTPFPWEAVRRKAAANDGLDKLAKQVDILLAIPLERLLKALKPDPTLGDACRLADQYMVDIVKGIVNLVFGLALIPVDLADLKLLFTGMGKGAVGFGIANGPDRAMRAAHTAVACPLLEGVDLAAASGILTIIFVGEDLCLHEFEVVNKVIETYASDATTILIGTPFVKEMSGDIQVVLLIAVEGKISDK